MGLKKEEEKNEPRKPLGQWLVENVPRGTNLELPNRKSLRLREYDYPLPGAYFITIVTQSRLCLLGEVIDGKVRLNGAGKMIHQIWEELPHRFPSIEIDAFVVMPNHIHGIVIIQKPVGASLVGARISGSEKTFREEGMTKILTPSLGDVVGAYKSITTVNYGRGVNAYGWQPFQVRLWQRNYYEHVIRDEQEMERARDYISNNPIEWEMDPENSTL